MCTGPGSRTWEFAYTVGETGIGVEPPCRRVKPGDSIVWKLNLGTGQVRFDDPDDIPVVFERGSEATPESPARGVVKGGLDQKVYNHYLDIQVEPSREVLNQSPVAILIIE